MAEQKTQTVAPVVLAEPVEKTEFEQLLEAPEGNLPQVAGAMSIQDPENIVAIRPDHLSEDEDGRIMGEAEALAQAIIADPTSLEVTQQLYAIGEASMSSNARHVELMDAKMGPLMGEVSGEAVVPKTLTQIKAQLDLVNPNVVATEEVETTNSKLWGLWNTTANVIVSKLPGGNQKIMEMINERRDTVKTTVDTLKGHLFTERDKALQNAIQLGQVADNLRETQEDLQESIYFAQLLWQRLNVLRAEETDTSRKQSFMYLTNDLSMRVVDLQTVDQLNMQSRMGAETLINNCRGLQMLVQRLTSILLPAVTNALIVKAAAAQQSQLAGSSRDIMNAAGTVIEQTAEDIRHVSVSVAKMNAEGMIDMGKLENACASYEAMQNEIEAVITNAERNARGVTTRLGSLNERMRNRVDPMTAARQAKEKALA
jgi:uncharacterized protein YaaN involved in tellurite resistance